MFNIFTPISYNTDINPFLMSYFTGAGQGFNPWLMPACNNFSGGSIFNFCNNPVNMYSTNPFSFSCNTGYYYNTPQPDLFSYTGGGDFNIYKIGKSTNTNSGKTLKIKQKQEATNIEKTQQLKTSSSEDIKKKSKSSESLKSNYLGRCLAQNAMQYLGYNENDGSYRKFSDSKEWCADFVSYVVNETYKNKGLEPPKGFGNHRVENLKQWGITNNKFFSIADKNNKAQLIADNVKVGDILILRENDASHTGIVSKVNSDGTFETIEGNRSDKVGIGRYNPNNSEISGFLKLAS